MKFSIFCILSLLMSWNISYGKEVEITCGESPAPGEIFKLLATVKNDILGTLPRFCRSDKYDQLSDQVDSGEKSLNDFILALKSKKSSEPDAFALDEDNIDDVVHQAIKFVVLRKMWNHTNESDQYSLLVSNDCGELGLNRFPYPKSITKNKILPGENKNAYNETLKVCKSVELKTLAPYMTKDVLAESLLNLKALFPQSFPQVTDSLCGNLKSVDELIFKEDIYSQFQIEGANILTAQEFSSWLKDTYKKVDKVIGKLSTKGAFKLAIEDLKNKNLTLIKDINELYEINKAESKSEGPFKMEDPYLILAKKNGLAVVMLDPEKEEAYLAELDKSIAAKHSSEKKWMMDEANKIKDSLEKAYIEYNKGAEVESDMPIPGNTGFFLTKNKSGGYEYKIADETKKKIAEAIKVQLKNSKPYAHDKETQEQLKEIYDLQEKYKDNMLMKTIDKNVLRDKEGVYYIINRETSFDEMLIDPLEIYFDEMNNKKGNYSIPLHTDEKVLIKLNDRIVTISLFEEKENYNPLNSSYKYASGLNKGYTAKNPYLFSSLPNNKAFEDIFHMDGKFIRKDLLDLVNMAATDKFQNVDSFQKNAVKLNPEEVTAVMNYTGAAYVNLNRCLRANDCSDDQKTQIGNMTKGLKKIGESNQVEDSESKIIFRGVDYLPMPVWEALEKSPKEMVVDAGFMSASGNVKVAKGFGKIEYDYGGQPQKNERILFVMKTKSCQGISEISGIKNEDEFLCPPGMKFNVKKEEGQRNVYILEEVIK